MILRWGLPDAFPLGLSDAFPLGNAGCVPGGGFIR